MRALVLQHIACEHPGVFRDFARERGLALTTVALDEGQAIPNPLDVSTHLTGRPWPAWRA